ncbi:MAG: undecaprenyl-phosphate glucose phosphotransferase [Phycisphaeraceae bacterium]|nr:MAG: undecaprenyl-phosphate glucose phosphotransferase [Phycisphaeraceae bacterium]
MLKQRHQVFVVLLGLADVAAVAAACYGAWAARLWWTGEPLPHSWEGFFKGPLVLFAVPIVIATLTFLGLYRPRRDRSLWSEQGQVLKGSVVSFATIVVALWAVGSGFLTEALANYQGPKYTGWRLVSDPARFQLAVFAMALPVLLGSQRMLFRLALRGMRRRGRNLRYVAIVGVGRLGQITARTLSRNSWTGLKVAYFVSHHPKSRRETCIGAPVHSGLEELEHTLEHNPVDAIYLALPSPLAGRMPELLRRLERFAVDVRIVPDVHPRYLPQSMQVSELEGMPILSYRECPLYGLGGFTKRLADMAGALLALVLFGPVMLVVAVGVRLSGPGPVIFKQKRVSLGGEVFKIYKFRTMAHVHDEQSPATWTQRDDPRVTRFGGFLRRTSLDELPQLINVLRGDMSLVGPRPERPELIERFRDDWRGYMLRQHVKAGITGWAQVNGLRGDTSLRKRLQYDLFYIRNWSLWLDVRILFLTAFRGFVHSNAH